jgi:hypothetical protein
MDFSPSPLASLSTLPATWLMLLPILIAVWWLAHHCFDKRLSVLRRQFDAQRAATREFLQHANSQIDLLQSELAQARRREDILRARQAGKAHEHTSARHKTGTGSTTLLSVLREQATVTSHKHPETPIAGCADKMHESPMLPAHGRSNIGVRAQAA